MRFWLVVTVSLFSLARAQDLCDVSNADKWDCGIVGTDQTQCEADGCCWQPVLRENGSMRDTPWCYYKSDKKNPCNDILWSGAPDAGFTQAFYEKMYANYRANLNIEGSGAVVAAPDQETPGGSYYYHWMRDAGLSIKAWLDINDNNYETVKPELEAYANWVAKVQKKADPNGIDVRIEPKFTIPDGEPYTGGWCRPQTDGPALRAMALSKWGRILVDHGDTQAAQAIWDLVAFDMAWVTGHWEETGCDLWEEVRSDDFFFNRMAYIYSLNVAADFADTIGQDGSSYRTVAESIKTATQGHWSDGFLYESTNRPYDGAVMHSIATFGEYLFPPESSEAAATIRVLSKAFCQEYPINQADIEAGKPGLLIGRYPGDSYAGGNPWQLLTAVFAEVFYLGGKATYKSVGERGGDYSLRYSEHADWMELLGLQEGATATDLAAAQVAAGDAVMTSLWSRVQDAPNGRIDEQIDKHTGAQTSAAGLTWSYANILHALHVRQNLDPGDLTTGTPTAPSTPATTTAPPRSCCSQVKFESTGAISQAHPEILGYYSQQEVDGNGKKVFKKLDDDLYLHYAEDVHFKYEAWMVSESVADAVADVINDNAKECADSSDQIWSYLENGDWIQDPTAKVVCDSSECCSDVSVSSSAGTAQQYPAYLGTYKQTSIIRGGQPVYVKDNLYLYFLNDVPHHFKGWTIAESLSELGGLTSLQVTECPDSAGDWEFMSGSGNWESDASLAITCV